MFDFKLTTQNLKMAIVFFGCALLVIVWGGFYVYAEAEREQEINNAVRETGIYALMFGEHTARTLHGMDQMVLFLKNQAEKEGLRVDIAKLVAEGRFAGQPFVQIGIADETGEVVANNMIPFVRANIKDREHFTVHLESDSRKLYVSKPVLGRTSGKWSIQLSRRINKPDGTFGGVAVVSVDPHYFADFYRHMNLGSKAVISLIGFDGVVRIRQSDDTLEMGNKLKNDDIPQNLESSVAGNFSNTSKIDGVRRIYAYRGLQDFPLYVIVGVSEEKVLMHFNQRNRSYVEMGAGISSFIILFLGAMWVGVSHRRRAEIQGVLKDIAEAAVTASSLDELYAKVHGLVEKVLPAKLFHINLVDEAAGEVMMSFRADHLNFIPERRPIGNGITEYIMRLGRTVYLNPAEMDRLRATREYWLPNMPEPPLRHYLGAPLFDLSGKAFGVVSLISIDEKCPFQGEDSEVLSIIAAQISLVTERKQAEEELRSTGDHLRKLIQYSGAPIVVWTPDLVITRFNRAFERLTGYAAGEVIGKHLSILFSEEQWAHSASMIEESRSGLQWEALELPIRCKNGEYRMTLWNSANIYDSDNVTLTAVIAQGIDITERVRREDEIRRDARLATRVQNALLTPPAQSEHLRIETIYQPFTYVGGDLYHLDWRYEGSLLRGFLVDVSGHGLGTALHTASLHVLLREANELDLPLSETMRWLNQRAGEYFEDDSFAGAIGFEIDLQTRQLHWACAGIPRFWLAAKSLTGVMECPGMSLGIRADETFETHSTPIDVSDCFYFMTDGLSDMLLPTDELPLARYSEMVEMLQKIAAQSDRRDDATAVCIQVHSLPDSLIRQDGWPREIRMNGYGDYQRYRGEVARILAEVTGLPHSIQEVAVNEALANAMECRDGVPRQHKARLRFNKIGSRFTVRVRTSRIGFAGNAVLRRLRSHPEELFAFGEDATMGRGIPMMLSMTDAMTYNAEGTELLLAWKLKDAR